MKISRIILAVFLLVIGGFILNIFISTGYFRTIKNEFDGEILKKIELPGAEDITINQKDSFAIISSTKRNFGDSKETEKGNLYFLDLKSKDLIPKLITGSFTSPFAPHGISIMKRDDSTYTIMAVNHIGDKHSLEVFSFDGSICTHNKTIKHPSIVSPNDVVLIDKNRFYFTNDHCYVKGIGKLIEDYGGLALSNVVYYDGQEFKEVANHIAYANGINYDSSKNLLFVASPRKFIIKVFRPNLDGSLNFIEDIYCGTGVDNIEFDKNGMLWIGCHPSLLKFSSYSNGKSPISPSEIIKIDYRSTGNYTLKTVFIDDGNQISASTVAAKLGDLILVGNVKDNHILILKNKDKI
jgi:arylesterase/paraoxonase